MSSLILLPTKQMHIHAIIGLPCTTVIMYKQYLRNDKDKHFIMHLPKHRKPRKDRRAMIRYVMGRTRHSIALLSEFMINFGNAN